MKRYISMFILIVVCFLLQTTLFQSLQIANVIPNLLLVLVAASGFMYGRMMGMCSGILCGLLMDCLYSNVIGLGILMFVIIGYINGMANKLYFKDDMSIPLSAIVISDFIYGIMYYMFNYMLRGRLDFVSYFKGVILPEAVYTVIVGVLLYKFLHWLEDKMYPPVEIPLEIPGVSTEEE